MKTTAWSVRPLAGGERDQARTLLAEHALPLDGLEETALWGAWAGDELAGVAGLEDFGTVALLRSVATRPAWRGRGAAAALCAAIAAHAAAAGAARLYLLTETADAYFERLGFAPLPRAAADPRLAASAEFRPGRCVSARLMVRDLQ